MAPTARAGSAQTPDDKTPAGCSPAGRADHRRAAGRRSGGPAAGPMIALVSGTLRGRPAPGTTLRRGRHKYAVRDCFVCPCVFAMHTRAHYIIWNLMSILHGDTSNMIEMHRLESLLHVALFRLESANLQLPPYVAGMPEPNWILQLKGAKEWDGRRRCTRIN